MGDRGGGGMEGEWGNPVFYTLHMGNEIDDLLTAAWEERFSLANTVHTINRVREPRTIGIKVRGVRGFTRTGKNTFAVKCEQ